MKNEQKQDCTKKNTIFLTNQEKNSKKVLAIPQNVRYTRFCCGMIAMKREVAARNCRFSVERMSS